MILPVSAIIPTRDRAAELKRLLASMAASSHWPAEVVLCDASRDHASAQLVEQVQRNWPTAQGQAPRWRYLRAQRAGLAPQRNQAVQAAAEEFLWFLDDDVELEPECLAQLHALMRAKPDAGGVTASLVNESYTAPGPWSRRLLRWMDDGRQRADYAGACVGPGWTFLPDATRLEVPWAKVEWLGGGCTLYRAAALPKPAVPEHFQGGAIGEDLATSLQVGRQHGLWHSRAARCVHRSAGGVHKRSWVALGDQAFCHRFHILWQILGQRQPRDVLRFAVMLLFGGLGELRQPGAWKRVTPLFVGYLRAALRLALSREGP